MAQIRIEQRRSRLGWLWLLILIVVLAAIIWYVLAQHDRTASGTATSGGTPVSLQYAPTSRRVA